MKSAVRVQRKPLICASQTISVRLTIGSPQAQSPAGDWQNRDVAPE